METLKSLSCLGITGKINKIFRMRNGAWENANYQIGDLFKICDSSPKSGDFAIAPDGKKVWIPQSEMQCFDWVD